MVIHASASPPALLQIDAVGTKRFDSQTGADREVQRILLELLTQMDGFDQSVNVKVSCYVCVCMHITAFCLDAV